MVSPVSNLQGLESLGLWCWYHIRNSRSLPGKSLHICSFLIFSANKKWMLHRSHPDGESSHFSANCTFRCETAPCPPPASLPSPPYVSLRMCFSVDFSSPSSYPSFSPHLFLHSCHIYSPWLSTPVSLEASTFPDS